MKITEENIAQLIDYWGNRTTKDDIPSEMKITVSLMKMENISKMEKSFIKPKD